MSGSVEIMVSGDGVEGVRLPVSPGVPVRGSVVLDKAPEGVQAPESSVVFLPVRSPLGETRNARVAREGLTFAVEDLPSGTYRVRLRPLPAGGYLKSVRVHGVELPGSELTITGDTPLSGVELVVAFDGGTVRGKVRRQSAGASGNPGVGRAAIVGLFPVELQRGCQLARYATVDDEGGTSSRTWRRGITGWWRSRRAWRERSQIHRFMRRRCFEAVRSGFSRARSFRLIWRWWRGWAGEFEAGPADLGGQGVCGRWGCAQLFAHMDCQ